MAERGHREQGCARPEHGGDEGRQPVQPVPDGAESECAGEPARAHRHHDETEPLRRGVRDELRRQDDALDRQVERSDRHAEQGERAQQPVAPDGPKPLAGRAPDPAGPDSSGW